MSNSLPVPAEATLPDTKVKSTLWIEQDPRRMKAVALLTEGVNTYSDIARQLGVSDTTLRNWRRHPEFLAELEEVIRAKSSETRFKRFRSTNRIADRNVTILEYYQQAQLREIQTSLEQEQRNAEILRRDPTAKVESYRSRDYTAHINRATSAWRTSLEEERTDLDRNEHRIQMEVDGTLQVGRSEADSPLVQMLVQIIGDPYSTDANIRSILERDEASNLSLESGGEVAESKLLLAGTEALLSQEGFLEDWHREDEEEEASIRLETRGRSRK